MKRSLVFILMMMASFKANSLPLPQFASAIFGLGEIILIISTVVGLYLPFLIKLKKNRNIILLLFLSFICNIYFIKEYVENNYVKALNSQEEIYGMVWDQKDRDKDEHALTEKEAYSLMSGNKEIAKKYMFIDARSSAETALGTAKGFLKIRWPDLVKLYDEDLKTKTIIVTCWTGMRGSSVCSYLRRLGIKCKYLSEGLKGWIAAGLPVDLAPGVELEDFGTAEQTSNSEKYLSAKDAVDIFIKNKATIVDIREPEAFKKRHLDASINIAFNLLSKGDLKYKLLTLPPTPIIVSCYGYSSCAEASTFAWEVNNYAGTYGGGIVNFDKNKNKIIKIGDIDFIGSSYENIKKQYKKVYDDTINYIDILERKISVEILLLVLSILLSFLISITKKTSFRYFKHLKDKKNKGDLYLSLGKNIDTINR